MKLNELLKANGIDNYNIISFIDAKKAVDNVLNRFSLLTNIMYFFDSYICHYSKIYE